MFGVKAQNLATFVIRLVLGIYGKRLYVKVILEGIFIYKPHMPGR
jgi:hypothetical protein